MATDFNIEYVDGDGITGTGRLTIDHSEIDSNTPAQLQIKFDNAELRIDQKIVYYKNPRFKNTVSNPTDDGEAGSQCGTFKPDTGVTAVPATVTRVTLPPKPQRPTT